MNKKIKYYALVWAILFITFNAICFITPNEAGGMSKYGGAFWASFIFINIAFIGQLVCACIALKTDDITKLFYNIPIIRVSYTGLVITAVAGAVCMAIPGFPNWAGAVIGLVILAFTAVAVIKAKAASEVVEKSDTEIKASTLFIKSLAADADNLISRARTDEARKVCRKVSDAVRYSDPVSNDALAGLESQITLKFNEFSNAVINDADSIDRLANELEILIEDRNRKCKLLK